MRKPGPKLENPSEVVRPRTYNVCEMTERKLLVVGEGNRSRGVRAAAKIAYDWWQRQPPK